MPIQEQGIKARFQSRRWILFERASHSFVISVVGVMAKQCCRGNPFPPRGPILVLVTHDVQMLIKIVMYSNYSESAPCMIALHVTAQCALCF